MHVSCLIKLHQSMNIISALYQSLAPFFFIAGRLRTFCFVNIVRNALDLFPLKFPFSIKSVKRADAGEYHCRLSVSNKIIESDSIILEVEGK